MSSSNTGGAAVPRSKQAKGPFGFLHNKLVDRVLREMTRPTDAAIPLANVETVISFINAEYENPELVVGLLAKLSRKFADVNVFSKTKAILTIHKVFQEADEKPKLAWAKAIRSMKQEVDEKVDDVFFSLESVADSSIIASNAQELVSSDGPEHAAEKAEKLLEVLDNVNAVIKMSVKIETALSKQCLDATKEDRSWALKLLEKLYESGELNEDDELLEDIEAALKSANAKFQPLPKKKAVSEPLPTSSVPSSPIAPTQAIPTPTPPVVVPAKKVEEEREVEDEDDEDVDEEDEDEVPSTPSKAEPEPPAKTVPSPSPEIPSLVKQSVSKSVGVNKSPTDTASKSSSTSSPAVSTGKATATTASKASSTAKAAPSNSSSSKVSTAAKSLPKKQTPAKSQSAKKSPSKSTASSKKAPTPAKKTNKTVSKKGKK
eukprot:scaffold156_cov173-Ochromonas_danica.AAC.6